MAVKIKCSACGQVQEVPDECVGKKIQCNGCKNEIIAELPQQENLLKQRPHLILSLVAAVMLFAAIWDIPYDYYKLLRLVVCIAAITVAFVGYKKRQLWVTNIFVVVALIFNPVVPLELAKELWLPIDIICGILFGIVSVPWKLRWFVCIVLIGIACYAGFLTNEYLTNKHLAQIQAEENQRQQAEAEQKRIKQELQVKLIQAKLELERLENEKQMRAEAERERQEKQVKEEAEQQWQAKQMQAKAEAERSEKAKRAEAEREREQEKAKLEAKQAEAEREREQEKAELEAKQAEAEREREQEKAELEQAKRKWQEATKRLVVGMTGNQVQSICGVPEKTSAIGVIDSVTWYYRCGEVDFYKGNLNSWRSTYYP